LEVILKEFANDPEKLLAAGKTINIKKR